MTADAGCFQPAGTADLILHEGKTFHQYTDIWDTKPRYSVASDAIKSERRSALPAGVPRYRPIQRRADDDRLHRAARYGVRPHRNGGEDALGTRRSPTP